MSEYENKCSQCGCIFIDENKRAVVCPSCKRIAELEREAAEHERLQTAIHNAHLRGIKAWQAETGQELTWPDAGDLVTWLIERANKAEREVAELRSVLLLDQAGMERREQEAIEVLKLRAQVVELRKDAERYRYLRRNAYVFGSTNPVGVLPEEPVSMWLLGSTDMTNDGIDKAIDAAIGRKEEHGS